jgi:DNA-binding transcriptional LysR family regulator
LEIRQLEMILTVVEKKGYVHAGEHLHLSHSAIHRQIRLIEEELGEKVFVRSGRTVRLTETGKLLVDLAMRVKNEVDAVLRQIKDVDQLASGQLRVGTGTTTLLFFLPPVLEAFRRRHPGLEMQIVTGTADGLIEEIQAGNLDLGLVSEPREGFTKEKNLHYERLYSEEFVLAVSRKHPLAKRKQIPWSELRDFPIITFPRTARIRRLIDAHFTKARVMPRIAMELENEEAIEKMIEITLGAGFIAKRRILKSKLHCLQVGDAPIVQNIAAVMNESYTPRSVGEFMSLCRDQAATHR